MSIDLRYSPQPMPRGWQYRIDSGNCAVCGLPITKNQAKLQGAVHREAKCSIPWTANRWTWGRFRDWYLANTVPLVCARCGQHIHVYSAEIDHIVPVASGGPPRLLANLQVLCVPCHKRKTKSDMKMIRLHRKLAAALDRHQRRFGYLTRA